MKIVEWLIDKLFGVLPDEQAFEKILFIVANRLVTPELRDNIYKLVELLMTDNNMPGEAKKEMVKKSVLGLRNAAGESARNTAGWVIDTIIQQAFLALAVKINRNRQEDKSVLH
jgi:hypothetical protein